MSMSAWIATERNPPDARVLPSVRLFAVLGTWMESDIVAATINNALTQGCERVYLIDNGSTDDTIKIARQEGAILAREFRTDRYDENLRLQHMNDVVREVSEAEGDQHIWWQFLDADEFPHGPSGMTIGEYLKTLDQRFRIVGARFFDHYPTSSPHYVPGRHPLDYQPLCEELAYPMCPARHRKHPLQRYDRNGPRIECTNGFHSARCAESLSEPEQPVFLHHFPFRQENSTRARLESLWAKDATGVPRAEVTHDTHMLTRHRSLRAVYAQDWGGVENFIALDPMYDSMESPPPRRGVTLRPWAEQVEREHVPVLRWYSNVGLWEEHPYTYGDDITYQRAVQFLDGHGTIEDWGCGFAHAKRFVTRSTYIGLDGSSRFADRIVNLADYRSSVDCILMRHVLEHNADWRRILVNALASFRRRMALILFTPFAETTRVIATSTTVTSLPVPDISFRKEDLIECFGSVRYAEESLHTQTQYKTEHVFYLEK
jgi:hypothetical protein